LKKINKKIGFYSCIVATLSSNMDLNLWTANKHYLKGEWLKVEAHPTPTTYHDTLIFFSFLLLKIIGF
jgi:hypothetical protein